MRGASLHLARELNGRHDQAPFDALLCSDFVNLPDLRALLQPVLRSRPVLYYLHENQLTYPLSPDEEFDPYFGFTNVLSCLSAEAVAFNSDFHRRQFLARLPGFLPRLPDYDPAWVVETIRQRAEVLPVGLDLEFLDRFRPAARVVNEPRRVLWNHRWEFDKRPERFFAALETLVARGVPFVADVVGESFMRRPPVFETARECLRNHIGHWGFVESREAYARILWQSDVVVSTAQQEFFGISMAEAVWCGAHPIAPRALVYEDLYGGPGSSARLYDTDAGLADLLEQVLRSATLPENGPLQSCLRNFAWPSVAALFDARFAELAP